MFTFRLIGQIGLIERMSNGDVRVVISTREDWIICECCDVKVREKLLRTLKSRDFVKLEGDVEPRLRRGIAHQHYDVAFVVNKAKRLRRA